MHKAQLFFNKEAHQVYLSKHLKTSLLKTYNTTFKSYFRVKKVYLNI